MLPTFLILGAGKAGTSSLYGHLRGHPDVFMSPVKEPNFFALRGRPAAFRGPTADGGINSWSVHDRDAYEALFDGAHPHQERGEASPLYLYDSSAPQAIRESLPSVRLVAVLRDPVDRAYSSWLHLRRDGAEPLPFEEALAAEPERIEAGWDWIWHYQAVGEYRSQVERYLASFPREQILFLRHDDLELNPERTWTRILAHVGVRTDVSLPIDRRHNVGGIPKNRRLHTWLARPNPLKELLKRVIPRSVWEPVRLRAIQGNLERPTMSPDTRARLKARFCGDVERTAVLTGLDLSPWLAS